MKQLPIVSHAKYKVFFLLDRLTVLTISLQTSLVKMSYEYSIKECAFQCEPH